MVSLVFLDAFVVPHLRFVEDKGPDRRRIDVFRKRARDFWDTYFDSAAAKPEHVFTLCSGCCHVDPTQCHTELDSVCISPLRRSRLGLRLVSVVRRYGMRVPVPDPSVSFSSGRPRRTWSRVAIYPPSVPPEGGMVEQLRASEADLVARRNLVCSSVRWSGTSPRIGRMIGPTYERKIYGDLNGRCCIPCWRPISQG